MRNRSKQLVERAIEAVIFGGGVLSVVLVVLIFLFVLKEALPLLHTYPLMAFLLGRQWQPTLPPPQGPRFGMLPNLWGSVLVTSAAAVIAVPLGISTAIFTAEIAPRYLRDILKVGVELMAIIPSVALGFVGAVAVNPAVKALFHLDTGKSAVAGSVVLAFMAIPTIATISEDALTAVPRGLREASLALGATRWQGIYRVVVPAAAPGILASVMLGVGRAIGETMVVIMVTGNAGLLPDHGLWYAFTHSVRTITGTIGAEALEVARGEPHYHALFMLGVVLFLITALLNMAGDYVAHRQRRGLPA